MMHPLPIRGDLSPGEDSQELETLVLFDRGRVRKGQSQGENLGSLKASRTPETGGCSHSRDGPQTLSG